MSALVNAGLVPQSQLLTTRGRQTGGARRSRAGLVEHDGRRRPVAPYAGVSRVHNARAAGHVRLARRLGTRAVRDWGLAPRGPRGAVGRGVRTARGHR
jgi:hypothetical protein